MALGVRDFEPNREAIVRNAWIGSADGSDFFFGLFFTFQFPDGSMMTHAGAVTDLRPAPDRTARAANTFLEISRYLHVMRVKSAQELIGRRTQLEIYGGSCVRGFKILDPEPESEFGPYKTKMSRLPPG